MSMFLAFLFLCMPDAQTRREHHVPQNWSYRAVELPVLPVGTKLPTRVLKAAIAEPSLQLLSLLLMLAPNMMKTSSYGLYEYSVVHLTHLCVSGFDSSHVVTFDIAIVQ